MHRKEPSKAKGGQWERAGLSGEQVGVEGSEGPAGSRGTRSLEGDWSVCSVMSDSFVTPWTVARQALLCMGLSRQEYWNALPFPLPRHLPDPGIEPASLILYADYLQLSHWGSLECD